MSTVDAPVKVPSSEIAPPGTDPEKEKMAHIVVPASKVTEAYITGIAVTALCGYTWVPSVDPHSKPKCRDCCDILDQILEADGRI